MLVTARRGGGSPSESGDQAVVHSRKGLPGIVRGDCHTAEQRVKQVRGTTVGPGTEAHIGWLSLSCPLASTGWPPNTSSGPSRVRRTGQCRLPELETPHASFASRTGRSLINAGVQRNDEGSRPSRASSFTRFSPYFSSSEGRLHCLRLLVAGGATEMKGRRNSGRPCHRPFSLDAHKHTYRNISSG